MKKTNTILGLIAAAISSCSSPIATPIKASFIGNGFTMVAYQDSFYKYKGQYQFTCKIRNDKAVAYDMMVINGQFYSNGVLVGSTTTAQPLTANGSEVFELQYIFPQQAPDSVIVLFDPEASIKKAN